MEAAISSFWMLLLLVTMETLISTANATPPTGAISVTLYGLEVRITSDASCCGRCNVVSPHIQTYATCHCDEYCLVYQDCCLDYELLCTNLEARLSRDWANGQLLETLKNCSKDSAKTPLITRSTSSNSSEVGRDFCMAWQSELAQSFIDKYKCQLEALWEPVILVRNSNRSFVRVPSDSTSSFEYMFVQDCTKGGGGTANTYDLCTNMDLSSGFDNLNDVKKLVPVTGPDGLHYRNIYCARCNGLQDQDLQIWQVQLDCPLEVRRVGLTDSSVGGCQFEFVIHPESFKGNFSQPRLVLTEEIWHSCDDCLTLQSKRKYERACRAYKLRTWNAKNPHCENRCSNCTEPRISSDVFSNRHFLSIGALFDFTTHRDVSYSLEGDPTVVVCDRENEFFDPELGACRRFYCPLGQTIAPYGLCVVLDTMSNQCLVSDNQHVISFQVDFLTMPSYVNSAKLIMIDMAKTLLSVTITDFDLFDCQVHNDNAYGLHCKLSFTAFSSFNFEETLSAFAIQIQTSSSLRKVLSDWPISLKKLSLRNFDKQELLVDRCGRLGHVPVGYSLRADYRRFEVNGSFYVVITVDNEQITCLATDDLYQEVVYRPFERQKRSEEFVYLCQMKLNCSMIILNSTEYTWLDNTTLRLSSGANLSSDEYIQLSDDQVVVCRASECLDCTHKPPFLGDTVFSLVCLSISQLFLFLCLLSFCLFPELWTLPGKNLFCSILALFLTQLVFLIGPGSPLNRYTISNENACLAFAVLIHYLLLAFFFWTNVVSLHFARTFGFQLRMRTKRFRRAFLWYSVYGWGAPVIISGTWFVIHRLLLTGRPGLVIYRHCLPYGVGALLLMAAPISILIMSNAVLFFLTVVGIMRTRKSISMVMKERRMLERLQTEVALCIKICVATGMSWILIFILGYVDVDGFSYLFSVLISVQGPLLFFCFAFTERVRAMWRIRISGLLTCESKAVTSEGAGASSPAMSTARTSLPVESQ